ncbi:hypothetical protein [Variovorax gossypii]
MTNQSPLLAHIESLKAEIEDSVQVLNRSEASGTLVLLRQQTMLTDLYEAVLNKVDGVDLSFEGEFDSVADALEGGDTDYSRALAEHKEALRAITPVIALVRAEGLAVHTPEIDEQPEPPPQDQQAEAVAEVRPHGI